MRTSQRGERKMQSRPPKNEIKSFRLSYYAIEALERLSNRLSKEAKTTLNLTRCIELAIFNAEHLTLVELLNPKPQPRR